MMLELTLLSDIDLLISLERQLNFLQIDSLPLSVNAPIHPNLTRPILLDMRFKKLILI